MALSNRDCRHGRQIGKCADCDLDHMTMAADAEARRVDELTALRKQDTELIRQLVEALEFKKAALSQLSPCMWVECKAACIEWRDAADATASAALAAGRARLGEKT